MDKNEGELIKKVICIDGKTIRGNRCGARKPSHIVSAWSKEDGFCLGQKAVEEKITVEVETPFADIVISAGFASSKGEVRRLLAQGGITLNGTKIESFDYKLSIEDFKDGYALLRKGKKQVIKLEL